MPKVATAAAVPATGTEKSDDSVFVPFFKGRGRGRGRGRGGKFGSGGGGRGGKKKNDPLKKFR